MEHSDLIQKDRSEEATRLMRAVESAGVVDRRLTPEQNRLYIQIQLQVMILMKSLGVLPKGGEGDMLYTTSSAPLFEMLIWRNIFLDHHEIEERVTQFREYVSKVVPANLDKL